MKVYKPLPIPKDSKWDRKTYNPLILIDRWISNKTRHTWFYWKYEDYISEPIWNLIRGIKNLWRWFPVIWKDRDWDSNYIFSIFKHKLLLQRKYIVKNNRHTRVDLDNRDMTICLNLIERIQEEYYGMEYLDYEDSKFRFEKTGDKYDGKDTYEMKCDVISETYDTYLNKYKSSARFIIKNGYKGVKVDPQNKQALCLYVAQHNQDKCQKLLFKILEEKISNWWD